MPSRLANRIGWLASARDSIYLDLGLSGENGKYAKEAPRKLPGEIGRKSPAKVEDTRIAARGTSMEIRLPEGRRNVKLLFLILI